MDHFLYRNDILYVENISVPTLVEQYGTPLYIYSRATLERHWHAFNDGFGNYPHLICYAVKANPNLAVLDVMARLGSGFDIVSLGELERVLAVGVDAKKIVFAGVGKRRDEIERALEVGILSFNVESIAELKKIETISKEQKKCAPISIRINPDIDAKTHPYISTGLKENKFGINIEEALDLFQYAAAAKHLTVQGIDCHIGSQLTSIEPFLAALERILVIVDQLLQQNIRIHHLNLGGGIGVHYHNENPPHPKEYSKAIQQRLQDYQIKVILEPGRAIAANAGILVTKIEYLKRNHHKHFAIVDAAMNDILRPAIYSAYHDIIPVIPNKIAKIHSYDIVGPVCETGDFLGKDRPLALQADDLLAVRTAGAYCFTMSSNYNSRPRAAEIMVDKDQAFLVKPRENLIDLFKNEQHLPKGT